MATHILTWFSNKNEENQTFIAAAFSQITCKSIHLSFIQYDLLVFNNLLQSPLKGIARGTQNFFGDRGNLAFRFSRES